MLGDLFRSLRYTIRSLRRSPGFSLTVVFTLALVIGANSSIFTLADAILFSTLPVPTPQRLIEISTVSPKESKGGFSIPAFQLLERQTDLFASAFAWNGGGLDNIEMNGIPSLGSV